MAPNFINCELVKKNPKKRLHTTEQLWKCCFQRACIFMSCSRLRKRNSTLCTPLRLTTVSQKSRFKQVNCLPHTTSTTAVLTPLFATQPEDFEWPWTQPPNCLLNLPELQSSSFHSWNDHFKGDWNIVYCSLLPFAHTSSPKPQETKQNPWILAAPAQKTVKQYSQLFRMLECSLIWKHISLSPMALTLITSLYRWIPGETENRKELWVYYHCIVAKSAVPLFFTLACFSSPAGYEPVPWHTSNIYYATNAHPPAHSSSYPDFLPLREVGLSDGCFNQAPSKLFLNVWYSYLM